MEEQLINIAEELKQIRDQLGGGSFFWGALVGFVSALLTSFFGWLFLKGVDCYVRPKFAFCSDNAEYCKVKTPAVVRDKFDRNVMCCYFRIKVTNEGMTSARNCRAYLTHVEKKETNGWQPSRYRDSIPLNWSYHSEDAAAQGIVIPRGIDQFIDVVATQEGGERPVLKTKPETLQYGDVLERTGTYRFTVHVCADRIRPVQARIGVEFNGQWNEAKISGLE